MNLPFPKNEDTLSAFAIRWFKDKAVLAIYPSLIGRQAALERVWQKAKDTSLVSIKGAMDEMVLFGPL